MRDQDNIVSRATAALAQSVASIVNSGDDDVTKRYALAETFTEFQTYLDRNVGGDIVEKSGAHDLAGRLIEHLTDALGHKRRQHGFEKKEQQPMESLSKIIKDAGFLAVAKAIADGRSYGLTEAEFVQFATEDAVKKFPGETPAAAFTRSFTDGGADGLTIRRAHRVVRDEQLAKAMPTVISGGDLRDAGDADEAMDALRVLGQKIAPSATPQKQFALAFEANPLLAARAHRRPAATTFFPPPR
jgi:hypothetical protein